MKNVALNFDNRFVTELPADSIVKNYPRQVLGACFSWVMPQQMRAPSLVAYSTQAAELLDLSEEFCQSKSFIDVFSGSQQMEGM